MILANVAVARELELRQRRHAVSRARQARREEARPAARDAATRSASPRSCPEEVTPAGFPRHHRPAGSRRVTAVHRIADRALDDAGGVSAARTSATSVSRSSTTRISPRRSAAIRTSSCIACLRAHAVGRAIRTACATTAAQLALAGAELTQLEKRADESDRYVECVAQVRVPARPHRPDLRRAHHDGGRVRRVRAAHRGRHRRPAAHRQPARRRIRDGAGRPRLGRAARASGACASARTCTSSSPA